MKRMNLGPGSVLWLRYDPKYRALEVGFRDGQAYRYIGVALDAYEAFVKTEAKGRFWNDHIRLCYPFRRLA